MSVTQDADPLPERRATPADVTMDRLDDQILWYDKSSGTNHRRYKVLKITVIIVAALIPLLSGAQWSLVPAPVSPLVFGAMGAAIAVIESIQQLNQYYGNWISYRSTCEALKHEKYLYLGSAGPYATGADRHALLAERVESLVSQENAKWASAQEIANRRAAADRAGGDTVEPRPAADATHRQESGQPQRPTASV
jgi:hypothetical protein